MTATMLNPPLTPYACTYVDPETMFVENPTAGPPDPRAVDAARAVCGGCSVREECLRGALRRDEQFGMWGGLTRAERVELRRRQARRAKQPESLPGI